MTPQGARDLDRVCLLLARYEKALDEVDSPNVIVALRAYSTLTDLFIQAKALYDEIVSDPLRWQEGLTTGAVNGLEPLRAFTPEPGETYGVQVPGASDLTDRAVEAYRCAY